MDLEDELKEMGFSALLCASTIQHALEILEDDRPDLALIEGAIGAELTTPVALRLAGSSIPYAIVTASARERFCAEPLLHGVPFLAKPFTPAELTALVVGLVNDTRTGEHPAGSQQLGVDMGDIQLPGVDPLPVPDQPNG